MEINLKLPAALAPVVFGALLSAIMSFIISGVSTWNAVGFVAGFISLWLASWGKAWLVAFPAVTFIAPLVRKVMPLIVEQPKV